MWERICDCCNRGDWGRVTDQQRGLKKEIPVRDSADWQEREREGAPGQCGLGQARASSWSMEAGVG